MIGVLARLYMASADNSYNERDTALILSLAGEAARIFPSMGSYYNNAGVRRDRSADRRHRPARQSQDAGARRRRARPQPAQPLLTVIASGNNLPEGHLAHGKTMENGQPTAYICQRGSHRGADHQPGDLEPGAAAAAGASAGIASAVERN